MKDIEQPCYHCCMHVPGMKDWRAYEQISDSDALKIEENFTSHNKYFPISNLFFPFIRSLSLSRLFVSLSSANNSNKRHV